MRRVFHETSRKIVAGDLSLSKFLQSLPCRGERVGFIISELYETRKNPIAFRQIRWTIERKQLRRSEIFAFNTISQEFL